MSFSVQAEKLSLEDLYKAAVNNRDIVKSYAAAKNQADLEKKIQKGDFYPSLDAEYKANKLDESSMFENEENSEFALSLTQNLFSGFKNKKEYEISKLDYSLSEYELQQIKQDISLQVASAVLNVYQADAKKLVAEDAYDSYKTKYENTKLQYSVGVAKKRDLLTMKVEKDDAAQNLRRAENELEKALNSLKRITGRDLKFEDIGFNVFKDMPAFSDFENYKKTMLKKRADILSLKTSLDRADASKDLAKAAYYPKVDLVLAQRFYSDEYNAFDSDTEEDETRIQLKVGINLFDGMKKYRRIDQADMEKKKTYHQLDELKSELFTELENLILDAETAIKNLEVARSGIKEAEENLRITELAFDKGVATASDVLDSIYYLSRARNNEINAEAGIFLTWFKIRRLTVDYPGI
jgi:outer membrane protein TolC